MNVLWLLSFSRLGVRSRVGLMTIGKVRGRLASTSPRQHPCCTRAHAHLVAAVRLKLPTVLRPAHCNGLRLPSDLNSCVACHLHNHDPRMSRSHRPKLICRPGDLHHNVRVSRTLEAHTTGRLCVCTSQVDVLPRRAVMPDAETSHLKI